MKRWILKAGVTDLDALVLEDVPLPEPGPGEVRVRVHAASLNARDTMILKGVFGRLPGRDLVPLSDGAGEIDAVGPGTEMWAVGDKVTSLYFDWHSGPPKPSFGTGLGSDKENGMLAEYVVLPATRITRAPASLDHAEASTLPCAALTAWNALFADHPIKVGSKVLVLGTGGVSLFALIFAHAAGAQVYATTSQDSKQRRLIALGASGIVNYKTDPNWAKTTFEMTGGVDKVVDAAGTLNESLEALGYGGEVVLMGLMTASEGPPPAFVMMAKNAIIRATSVGSEDMYAAMAQAIDVGGLKPPIDRNFRFEDAKEAYRAQTAPETFGKIVIDRI